jgi:hypothetical protein
MMVVTTGLGNISTPKNFQPQFFKPNNYRMSAILTRSLYPFYPIFEVHLCTVTFGLKDG